MVPASMLPLSRAALAALAALISTTGVAAGMMASGTATAATQMELEQLIREQARRLDEQDARLKALEEQLSLRAPPTSAAPSNQASLQGTPGRVSAVTATDHAFAIGNAANQLRFHAILNVDGRDFGDRSPPSGADGWLLRQARPILEGTVSERYDFRLTPDFGGGRSVIQDAFVTGRFGPSLQLTAGKFKVPFGLERLQYDTDIRFVERGLTNNLVPNRDLGLQLAGEFLAGRFEYALAVQNGVSDGGSSDAIGDIDSDNEQEFTARAFTQPFRDARSTLWQGLGIGIATNYSSSFGGIGRTRLPSYYSPGQRLMFSYRAGSAPTIQNGQRVRVSPQLFFYRGPFGLLGEVVEVEQAVKRTIGTRTRAARLRHRAWQLEAGWYLTGEPAAYRAVAPTASFGSGAGFGAIELVARAGTLEIDSGAFLGGTDSFADPALSIRHASAVAAGVNWYLTPAIKTVLDFELTTFHGGALSGDRSSEKALFGRFQVGF